MDAFHPESRIGIPEIDHAHQVLAQSLAELEKTDDANFSFAYFSLVAMLERDFRLEESLMEDYGLPSLPLHREQHSRVLGALHHAQPRVMAGDLQLGRHTLELLPQWLEIHAATMDQALAAELEIAKAVSTLA